jgi:carbon storage regulator CsrA
MMVLTRKVGESVNIGGNILITVIEIRGDKVRLGVVAPKETSIHRQEVWEALFGPASRVVLDPAWLTWNDGTVPRLARAIADEGNYGALPILADALEEAGCTDAAILGHCRTCRPDVRSSWVVRFILSASRDVTAYTVTLSALDNCGSAR